MDEPSLLPRREAKFSSCEWMAFQMKLNMICYTFLELVLFISYPQNNQISRNYYLKCIPIFLRTATNVVCTDNSILLGNVDIFSEYTQLNVFFFFPMKKKVNFWYLNEI